MNNKILNPVGVDISAAPDIDADDLGQRLVECVSKLSADTKVVNLIKVKIGDNITAAQINHIIQNTLANPLKEMGAKNCIFVPLREGCIEDIKIDYIVVKENESNN